MKYSFSRVETYKQCPYKFKLSYIDELSTIPNQDANNPLYIGSAMHRGIEIGPRIALDEYYNQFNIINSQHEIEALKIEYWLNKIRLPNGQHEIKLETDNFVGYVDFIDDENNLYDFKYSNNIDGYKTSNQLHVYKYFYDLTHDDKINKLYYLFIPKTFIRQKKVETENEFLIRLKNTLNNLEIKKVEIKYDKNKVNNFFNDIKNISDKYPKVPNKYCDFCEFNKFCKEGDDWMLLPKNEKRDISKIDKYSLWIYGSPFSGKTTFANKFPDPLMLNTDGNIKFVDAPYIPIKDEIRMEGRLKKKKFAWQVFKEAIDELEKKENDFKTIVADLLEDLYEYCRLYMYDQLGISHESDDSFRAWDKVRTEFLSNIKRLMNLDYNIILISHEDSTKDITKRTGDKITAIKPNLSDKVANKVAGMVDVVGRVYVEDDKRLLSLKADEVVFGGGRLNIRSKEIALEFEKFKEIYNG